MIVAMATRLPGAVSLLVTLGAGILVPACGGSGGATPRQPNGPAYEVTTETIDGVGDVLVDGKGFALYLFEPDRQSSRSTCSGPCAVGWPPLVLPKDVTKPLVAGGAMSSLLGTTTRSDGTVQVTYDGWPLYRWANDRSPGEATGQDLFNLGGRWYVVSPQGRPVT
jgi:predicted lipoprotein with Yx(FWY)xxD motif